MPFIKCVSKSMMGEKVNLRINFNSKRNCFWCRMPEKLTDVVQENGELWERDINDLEVKIGKLFRDYNELKTTERKVIVFTLDSEAWTRTGSGSASGSHTRTYQDLRDADYIEFKLEHVVCFEVTKDGYSKYYRDDRTVSVGRRNQVIEWSEEAEDFFISVQDGISKLIDKLGSFVKENKDDLPKAIKNQKNLLPFQGGES